jgi:hypothetical protein
MANLTPEQAAALAYVNETDDRWRAAKVNAKRRAAELVERELAQFAAARDNAVWEAIELGVPKRQVGQKGLKTTSPNTINDIYNRAQAAQGVVEVQLASKPVPEYQWSSRHIAPVSGLPYWYLLIDGDDYETTAEGYEGKGYLRVRLTDGSYLWPDTPPPTAARQWAEQNKPA